MLGVIRSHTKKTNTLNMRVDIIDKNNPTIDTTCDKIINISRIRDATLHIKLTDTKINGIITPDDRNDSYTWHELLIID